MPNEDIDFLESEVAHGDVAAFGEERVNLPRDSAQKYRDQVNNLRDHLDRYITEHPDLGLVKMLLSGSLAKGTALRTINDVDVAMYVRGDAAPDDLGKLLDWLVEKLRATFPQMAADAIYVDGPCVVVSFKGTGINVEVAPILYEGDKDWRGYLYDRSSRKKVLTSIPQHLEFIRKRKAAQPDDFAQVVRFLKWWADQRCDDTPGFSLRSFTIELLMAKIADDGKKFDDYHNGLVHFFNYVLKTQLKERVAFTDFYSSDKLPKTRVATVEIFDPVNADNNLGADITESQRVLLVQLAEKALDALSYARTCQTKGEAVECWQELMGPSFNP